MKTRYDDATPFITKDGSVIREFMHPDHHASRTMSFAEAIVSAGAETLLHYHTQSEEIYHITAGHGVMRLGERHFPIASGDTIVLSPGTPHNVINSGTVALKILCACHPAYSHDDTIIMAVEKK